MQEDVLLRALMQTPMEAGSRFQHHMHHGPLGPIASGSVWRPATKQEQVLQALVQRPVETGTRLEHHMYYGPFGSSLDVMGGAGLRARGPRLLSATPHPGWKPCALTVIECKVGLRSISCCKPCFS